MATQHWLLVPFPRKPLQRGLQGSAALLTWATVPPKGNAASQAVAAVPPNGSAASQTEAAVPSPKKQEQAKSVGTPLEGTTEALTEAEPNAGTTRPGQTARKQT